MDKKDYFDVKEYVLLEKFVKESNRIENIQEASIADVQAHYALLSQRRLTVDNVKNFVSAVQPGAELRVAKGQDVTISSHTPPSGGMRILTSLEDLLAKASKLKYRANKDYQQAAYRIHHEYETLHPFTDGNGRSGRAIWLWMMGGVDKVPLGFLHTWYYQSLKYTYIKTVI